MYMELATMFCLHLKLKESSSAPRYTGCYAPPFGIQSTTWLHALATCSYTGLAATW